MAESQEARNIGGSGAVVVPVSCVPRGPTISGRWAVAFVTIGPLVVGAIVAWVAYAYRSDAKPMMNQPEIGAGAGHTGMYNEYGGIGKKPANSQGK